MKTGWFKQPAGNEYFYAVNDEPPWDTINTGVLKKGGWGWIYYAGYPNRYPNERPYTPTEEDLHGAISAIFSEWRMFR
jgi:hypothetical protein